MYTHLFYLLSILRYKFQLWYNRLIISYFLEKMKNTGYFRVNETPLCKQTHA